MLKVQFMSSIILLSQYFYMDKKCGDTLQGRIQDFKLGGGALKKIAPSRGRRENFRGISCEKSLFYAKKS